MINEAQPVRLTAHRSSPTLRSEVSLYMATIDGGQEGQGKLVHPRPTTNMARMEQAGREVTTQGLNRFNGLGLDPDSRATLRIIEHHPDVPADIQIDAAKELSSSERARIKQREAIGAYKTIGEFPPEFKFAGGAIDPIMDLGTKTFTNAGLSNIKDRLVALRGSGRTEALDLEMFQRFYKEVNDILQVDTSLAGEASDIKEAIAKVLTGGEDEDVRTFNRGFDQLQAQIETARITPALAGTIPALIARREKLRDDMVNELIKSVSSHPIPRSVVERIATDQDFLASLKKLAMSIISKPWDSELTQYRLGFYEDINITTIESILKAEAEEEWNTPAERAIRNQRRADYQTLLLRKEAFADTHNANIQVVTLGSGTAEIISLVRSEHLQVINGIQGSGEVQRFFDNQLAMIRARDGSIDTDTWYRLMGFKRNIKGEVLADQSDSLREKFIDYVQKLKARQAAGRPLTGDQEDLVKLKSWELELAYNAGRMLTNINLRSPEHIAWGQPKKGSRAYPSSPQEYMVRNFNFVTWMLVRFGISADIGGMPLIKKAIQNFMDKREEQGFGRTNLKRVANTDLEVFEAPVMIGAGGMFTSWRLLEVLGEIPWNGGTTNLADFLGSLKTAGDYENALLSGGELREEFNQALGVLLMQVMPANVSSLHPDSKDVLGAKSKVREAIWRRTARDNPLAMANMLHGTQVNGQNAINIFNNPSFGGTATWESLRDKLFMLHEIRMSEIRRGASPRTLDQVRTGEAAGTGGIVLDPQEEGLLNFIRNQGTAMAGEFASLRLGFTPFMNDVAFEKINFDQAGPDALRRRIAGDIASLSQAGNKFVPIMDNPAGADVEKALEAFSEMRVAIGSILGTDVGQEKVSDFFMAFAWFVEKGGSENPFYNSPIIKELRKSLIVSVLIDAAQRRNSIAQHYGGHDALALSEIDMFDLLKKANKAGIVNHEIMKRFKKKFGMGWFQMFFKFIFRDLMVPLVATGGFSLIKQGFDAPEFKS